MQSSSQEQLGLGNTPTSSQETLTGANTRLAAGISQCVVGVIEVAFGITIVSLPWTDIIDNVDRVSFGIWGGVFSILAGAFGIASRRSRCLVISYMVFSIVAATMGVLSMAVATLGIVLTKLELDENGNVRHARTHLALYIALCVSFFLQVLASIIGATFTCGVFFTIQAATSRPMVIYNPPQSPSTLNEREEPYANTVTSSLPLTPAVR